MYFKLHSGRIGVLGIVFREDRNEKIVYFFQNNFYHISRNKINLILLTQDFIWDPQAEREEM